MPFTLLVLVLVSVLGFTLVILGMTEVSIGTNWRAYNAAFYAADAGIESGMVGLRALFGQTPSPSPAQLGAIAAPVLTSAALANVTFPVYSVAYVSPAPPGSYQTTFSSGPYVGLSGITTDYRITSQAAEGGTRANLTQIIQYVQVPLFQFGVFYGKGVDLEIAPGPAMTFNGRVHANSNIYVGAGSTLQFQSNMTTAGNIYRRLKRDASIPWGNNPQIKDAGGAFQTLNFDHDYQAGFSSTWSQDAWKSAALSLFGGKVQDSAMGVAQIIPPIPELFNDPANPDVVAHQMIETVTGSDSPALKAAKLHSQADLRIVDGIPTDKNGNPVGLPPNTVTTTSFYDAREQRTMTITQMDVSKLVGGGAAPANGVLYVASTVGTGKAVRLINGTTLPSQGLTVVSQNPVYIRGDYNTVSVNAGQAHPPAAILADAITVLSNNWKPNNSDIKGDKPTDQRPASSTTVNAAFALGPSAESTLGQGNGQLENDIRFLEDWSGQTLTYSGSLINLWHSLQATGAWRCCGSGAGQYYNAPIRNWGYDTLFNTTPPPGTPAGVVIVKGAWSQS